MEFRKEIECEWCGMWFFKEGAQKYCCPECACLAGKERDAIYKRERRKKVKPVEQKHTGPTMDDVLCAMAVLSKERGEQVQYGEVQTALLNGTLKIDGGKIVCGL